MADVHGVPTGTVTFLFTDIEGSSGWWQDEPDVMRTALAEHDVLLRDIVEKRRGHVFKHTGDGIAAAFWSATDAVDAAVDAQSRLTGLPFRVRMGLHTGEAEARSGDYFGPTVNRCARLMAVAHGGQIVLSDATAVLVRDRDDLVDLGEHRLRDLAGAERVSQVGDRTFPPLRSLSVIPGNLPTQLTSFIGRDDELAQVATTLRQHRVVTITGPGGIGKTRLAIQIGAERSSSFRHGVWLVELAPVLDADAVPFALASVLGVRQQPGLSMLESVQHYLGERQLLLLLDNCEHVLGAAGHVAASLVRACPEVSILATSREPLAVSGERIHPLRSLVREADAVDLFTDRARGVDPSFEPHGADIDAVRAVCRALDGIPLAIELAAARTVSLTPGEIAGRLDRQLRLLTIGQRDADPRHRTLRTAVDWSYALLDARSRSVFDQLSVFAGGFTLEAAEAVVIGEALDADDLLDALTGLVAKSMIVADRRDDGTHRYRLLETMRQYALERLLESDTINAVRARHATYMASFAARAKCGWRSPDEQRWRRRLADEIDNLRAATGWAVEHRDTDLACRVVGPLSDQARFYPPWGIGALADVVLTLPSARDHPLALCLLAAAGQDAFQRGDLQLVVQLLDEATAIAREPARVVCASVWADNAGARVLLGDVPGARRCLDDGMRMVETVGDPFEIALLVGVASALIHDDGALARSYADRAASAIAEVGGPEMRAYVAAFRGMAYFESDPRRAIQFFEDAFAPTADIETSNIASYGFLAVLYADQGDAAQALRTARAGIVTSFDLGWLPMLDTNLAFIAVALSILGHHPAAAVLYAVDDAGTISPYAMESTGWQTAVRRRGRALTLAAFDADAIDQRRPRASGMSVPDVVSYALAEIDSLLADMKHDADV